MSFASELAAIQALLASLPTPEEGQPGHIEHTEKMVDILDQYTSLILSVSVVSYQGTWAASTNTPTLVDGTGDEGDFYKVSAAGTRNLGSGSIAFAVGDFVVYDGGIWARVAAASISSRQVSGAINTSDSGSIVSSTPSSAFTISRTGTGLLTVTFATPFTATPQVAITAKGGGSSVGPIASIRSGTTPSTTGFQVEVVSIGSGYADGIFHFIANGPA